ncbi:MAG: response regulator [Clostridia bacterium]|nr:response regulator [Clostridia bacterium]
MRTLLIVDDEMLLADGLRAMLAEEFPGRLTVLCCYSAEQALSIAGEQTIDILLTDINMPDCSGLELHKRISAINPDCRVIYLTGYSEFEYARTALDQRAFAYVLKGEGDEFVISTIERALSEPDPVPPEPQDASAEADSDRSPDWLMELHSYIMDHLNDDLSLNTLADFCHFHPVYLSHVYKEETGTTLSDYINRVRIEEAESLLLTSRMTVLEISRQMGFASDNYFCRWFRKQTGMSPQTYRSGKHA